jgi:hypothetical protein
MSAWLVQYRDILKRSFGPLPQSEEFLRPVESARRPSFLTAESPIAQTAASNTLSQRLQD